jgi:hypothetical protein
VPAATADKPTREILLPGEDFVITDQCAFPVNFHVEGISILTLFTDRAGNPIKFIGVFPGQTVTFTNLFDTDTSITVNTTGPIVDRIEHDGSESLLFTGHTPFFPNPITDEPGIWYSSGQLAFTFDPDGNLTSIDFAGNFVNLCDQLAS